MKLVRHVEEGPHPGVELGEFLTDGAHFPHSPAVGGSLEYRPDRPGALPSTLVTVDAFVPHECDGWSYVVDALRHGLEEALAHQEHGDGRSALKGAPPPASGHTGADTGPPPARSP